MELEFSGVPAPTRCSRGKRGSGACNAAANAPGPLLSERVKESLVPLMLSPPRRKPGPIVPPHEPVIVGKRCDCLRSSRRRAVGPGFRRDDKGCFVYPNLDPVFFTCSFAGATITRLEDPLHFGPDCQLEP